MFVIPYDPHDLAAKLVDRKGLDPEAQLIEREEPEVLEAPDHAGEAHAQWLHEIAPLLDRIPAIEADLIELHYFRGSSQQDIGDIFETTQSGISYRLQRARERLRLLQHYPGASITEADCQRDLGDLYDAEEVQLVWHVISTTCHSEAARRIGWGMSKARWRALRAGRDLAVLATHYPQLQRYADALDYVRDHGAFLHEQPAHWTKRRKARTAKR